MSQQILEPQTAASHGADATPQMLASHGANVAPPTAVSHGAADVAPQMFAAHGPAVAPQTFAAHNATEPSVEDAGALWDAMLAEQQRPPRLAPAHTPEIQMDIEGEPSIIDEITSALTPEKGGLLDKAFAGPQEAVNQLMDLSYSTGKFAKDVATKGWDAAKFTEENAPLRFTPPEFDAPGSKFMKDVNQIVTGFAITGTVMKAGQVLKGASEFARSMVQGGLADFHFLDANQERFSNFIESFPFLRNPLTEYMAAKKEDESLLDGRLKNLLEGVGLGAAVEGVIKGFKCFKAMREAETAEAALKALERVEAESAEGAAKASDDVVEATIKPATDDAAEGGAKAAADDAAEATTNPVADASVEGVAKGAVDDAVEGESRYIVTDVLEMDVKPAGGAKGGAKVAGGAAEEATEAPVKTGYKTDALLPTDQIKAIIDKAADAETAFTEITDSINLQRLIWDNPQGSHIMRGISDALADKTLKAAGPESHTKILADATEDLAAFGIDSTELIAKAGDDVDAIHAIARRQMSNRVLLHQMTTKAGQLAQKVNLGTASAIDHYHLDLISENIQQTYLAMKDAGTELARALSSMRKTIDDNTIKEVFGEGGDLAAKLPKDAADDFTATFPAMAGITEDEAVKALAMRGRDAKQIRELAESVTMADGDPAAVGRMLNASKPGSWWGVFTEMWYHNLLSSPITWGGNAAGNAMKVFSMPAERMIGGAMNLDAEAIKSGARTYAGLTKFMSESLEMAWKAMKLNRNILDSKNGVMEIPTKQVTYDNIKNLLLRNRPEGATLNVMEESLAWVFHGLGKVSDFSSRALIGTDELFKQMYFRADMYSKLYGQAVDVKGLKGVEIDEFIKTEMNKAFQPDGAVARGELTADSLLKAQQGTWTQTLEQGSVFNWVQTGAAKYPLVRLVVPFVKTPSNIILDMAAHAPTAPLGKKFRAAWAQGGEARADVLGQVALGTFTLSLAAYYAHQGLITGSPPKDPKLRAQLEASGWQPYSIKLGGKYYSFRRLDPVGGLMGSAADLVNLVTRRDDLSELELKDAFFGVAATAINNVLSKTYMQGVMEVVNAVGDPERYLKTYAGRMSSTFVPSASLLRLTRQQTDPHMREMENISDYVKNTIPGMSDDLPARRNWVTGDFVDYRLVGQHSDSVVMNELVRLGKGVLGAPDKSIGGVKLSSAQYSRLCELHGTVKFNGKTMHQALEKLMTSPHYDLERKRFGDAPDGLNKSRRGEMVNDIIDLYRDKAVMQLRREDRELSKTITDKKRLDAAAKAGVLRKDNQQDMLQRLIK